MVWGSGVRWTPLPKAEAPTEPAGENGIVPDTQKQGAVAGGHLRHADDPRVEAADDGEHHFS